QIVSKIIATEVRDVFPLENVRQALQSALPFRNDLRRDLGIGPLDVAHRLRMNPFPEGTIGKGDIGMGGPEGSRNALP
ncbi:hypothetical protein, partial [Rhizobium leguminosarum]|uniref:hypothetical protein n=1 Tax=Rhizobium leguminosarum TaxID=384 RepID=UPI003F9AFAF7